MSACRGRDQLKKEDINIPPIKNEDIPQFKEVQVWILLKQLRTNISTVKGDLQGFLKNFQPTWQSL